MLVAVDIDRDVVWWFLLEQLFLFLLRSANDVNGWARVMVGSWHSSITIYHKLVPRLQTCFFSIPCSAVQTSLFALTFDSFKYH